ncbi:ankyrin repeat [Trichoderma arundinaceum]|uniref:Ankyrin repeat n=1 Tax=Trichoderma arundinaceum TaxID=490622 RepID=A0A395NIW0_TRIAR|nr:ankyrin repeat [Trichoderma arundinaceum]
MSKNIIQNNNTGLVQAIHNGDNVFYDNNTAVQLTLKHIALETHKKVMAEWKASQTCEWLMHKSDFQSWRRMDTECSFLWLYGRPGCGKSTLMSRVIESIYEGVSATDAIPQLLYFYVRYGNDQEKDKFYRNMWMTFWEQAIGKTEDRHINPFGHDTHPKIIEEELYKLLASSQQDIYIIIDALDQFNELSRDLLLQSLDAMVERLRKKMGSYHLRVAISSRGCNGIGQLRAHKLFPIEVTTESNRGDINIYLEKNLNSALFRKKPQLRKQTLEKLSRMADGTFLWASLQTLNICNMQMESQVLHALTSLTPPESMRAMYEAYADGFESLEDLIEKQITQRTMALLANNSGAMSQKVILAAVSMNDKGEVDPVVHQELTADPTLIVGFCNHLVRINEMLGVFQFCHKTVFEFFVKYKSSTYNHRIAELCLSHLCSPEFSQGPRSDATWFNPGSLAPILQKHLFLPFASSRWAISIKKSLASEIIVGVEESHCKILNLLNALFKEDNSIDNRGNLQLAFQVHLLTLGKKIPKGVSHDHIVSYFGLVKFFDIFKERQWLDLTKADEDGLLPIHWAIRNEFELSDATLTVQKLIEYGAHISVRDKNNQTPLYYASHHGNLQMVQFLVRKKAPLNDTNIDGETALIAACRKHHHDIILYLIKEGSDVKIQSSFGTALQVISLVGCCSCAGALLDSYGKSKVVERDGPFGTSLHAAAFNGHAGLVKLLCSRLPNIRATHPTYGSPLTAAAAGFNPGLDPAPFKEIMQELIKYGVKVNDKSGLVGPALRAAAYHGSGDLVRLLLERGAKIRKAKGPMGTVYEAAEDRGHQHIKDILLERDPKAADYKGSHTVKPLQRQQIQRKVFRATVKTSSIDTIHHLVTQFEKFFEKEIKRGDTSFLRSLAKLGEDSFQDVIILATKARGESSGPAEAPRQSTHKSRLREIMSTFRFAASTDQGNEPASENTEPVEESPYLRRSSTNFAQDSLGEHFPQVLDRMTQAAVKILEDAIANENRNVIRLITNTWVKALNDLVSHPGFGEPMLRMVVQGRAEELKKHLINRDLSLEERFTKTTNLAQVGIELLLVAVERGQKFRHLCFVISKLWIEAVSDVEELGEEGEAPLQEMIRIFARRFSSAVAVGDPVNAEICAQAGIELLRAAALIPKTTLLERFGHQWVILWVSALEKKGKMEYMATQLILRRREEFQECLKDKKKHDKALGLALASLGILREAFGQRSELAVSTLQPVIESSFRRMQESYTGRDASAEIIIYVRDLEPIVNAVIKLFVAAEEIQPGRLNILASKILDLAGAALGDRQQELEEVAKRRIDEADRIVHPPEREKQLMNISSTILVLLDVALGAEKGNMAIVSKLGEVVLQHLAVLLPKFTERADLAQYTRAVEYLRSRNR